MTGSVSVCRQLIAAELVDEYRLLVYPVVAGVGGRLLDGDGDGIEARKLNLVATDAFTSGLVLLRYQPT